MEYVRCQLCNSDDTSFLFSAKNSDDLEKEQIFNIVKCNNCSSVYTNPRPDRIEIGKYYPEDYYGTDNAPFNKLLGFVLGLFRKSRAREIASLITRGRILDIGCGQGEMLSFLKKRQWQVVGTEISAEVSRYGENLNLEVIPKDLVKIKFPNNHFDVITSYNSLEHLPNPKEVLKECNRILKPGGWLIMVLPNFESIQAKVFKNNWFHLDVPRHYYHFSPLTLKKMLQLSGFEIKKVKHFSLEYNPYGVLQSLLNKIGLIQNALYDILKSGTAHLKKCKVDRLYLQVFIAVVLLPFLTVITAGICLVESVLGKGGTMKVYAGKI